MKVKPVDFHLIEQAHEEIHKRLENWARWAHGGGGSGHCSPMFRLYRPDNYERGPISTPVDGTDAQRIAKAVTHLPMPHRQAINWSYISPTNPRRACQTIGTSMEGLALYISDARTMLVARRV